MTKDNEGRGKITFDHMTTQHVTELLIKTQTTAHIEGRLPPAPQQAAGGQQSNSTAAPAPTPTPSKGD